MLSAPPLFLAGILAAGPAHAMNYTLVHRTPLDASLLRLQGASALALSEGLAVTQSTSAEVESAVIEAPAPFDDLVGSWNAMLPKGSSLEMQVRVRRGAEWSGWFLLGRAEPERWVSAEKQEGPFGFLDVDTLRLKEKAAAFQYRFLITAQKQPAILKLAAVTVSDGAPSVPPPFTGKPAELKIRPRSQMEEQEKYKHDICSPTSLSMALDFWRVRGKTVDVAEKVRDSRTAIFGHWPFNAASAGDMGVEAWVARLGSMTELERLIADGRPVVVSVTFGPGELDGAPIKRTSGHLILVAGFTAKGDVIALDPAAPRKASARRVYDRAQFHGAWFVNKRGLAYVLSPLRGRRLAVGLPVADLFKKPRQRRKADLDDDEHLSQLLYGETVLVERVRGDWVQVVAEEQPHIEGRRWGGYRGWLRADALTAALPTPSNCVVRTRQALAQRGQEILAFSVGTRLTRVLEASGVSVVRLLDGSLAEIATDALSVPPPVANADSRSEIIKTAELFLGTSYYWGGRSGVQPELSIGVDCSGLVSLAYRVHGLDIPRDSQAQFARARPVKRGEMQPGDLVFLSEPGHPKRVSHVMIYTGGDSVIESRKSSGRVLRSSFKERFGRPLGDVDSGAEVLDQSFAKPKRRRVFFGAYL
jgi:hypothetical protein